MKERFWGEITSTINWCEDDYVITPYIAEFFNTISNIIFLIAGIFGWIKSIQYNFERSFHILYIGVIIIGVGSATFHATLTWIQQYSDETPMIWVMMIWIYVLFVNDLYGIYEYIIPIILTLWAIIFSIIHWEYRFTTAFQLHFALLAIIAVVRASFYWYQLRQSKEYIASNLFQVYVCVVLLGLCFWLFDFHYCEEIRALSFNPQGHAIWHIMMGISSYFGPVFAQYVRAKKMGFNPQVKYTLKFIPFIVTKEKL